VTREIHIGGEIMLQEKYIGEYAKNVF